MVGIEHSHIVPIASRTFINIPLVQRLAAISLSLAGICGEGRFIQPKRPLSQKPQKRLKVRREMERGQRGIAKKFGFMDLGHRVDGVLGRYHFANPGTSAACRHLRRMRSTTEEVLTKVRDVMTRDSVYSDPNETLQHAARMATAACCRSQMVISSSE